MRQYRLPKDSHGETVQVIQPASTINFTFGATATSATSAVQSNLVRLWSSVNAHVKWVAIGTGTDAAATTDMPITAEVPEYIGCPSAHFLSALIQATATATAGSIYCTEPG